MEEHALTCYNHEEVSVGLHTPSDTKVINNQPQISSKWGLINTGAPEFPCSWTFPAAMEN